MKVKVTEKQFTTTVIQLARLRGWRVAHFRPGMTRRGTWVTAVQGDGVGFPDLFMVRGVCLIAAELKVGKNKSTKTQEEWLEALEAAGVSCFRWHPDDWQEIERVLEHGA